MYTQAMRDAFHSIPKPLPFTVDVADGEDGLHLVVYADEILNYDQISRFVVMEYLDRVKTALERVGATVELEGRHGSPPRR